MHSDLTINLPYQPYKGNINLIKLLVAVGSFLYVALSRILKDDYVSNGKQWEMENQNTCRRLPSPIELRNLFASR